MPERTRRRSCTSDGAGPRSARTAPLRLGSATHIEGRSAYAWATRSPAPGAYATRIAASPKCGASARSTRRRRDPSVERGHGAPSWQTGTCAGELSPRAARPAHRRPDVTTPEAGTDAGGHTLHRPRPMCAALRAQSSALARERRLARRHPRAPEVPPRDAGLDPRITDGPVSEAGARVRTAPREPHILRCCEARQRGEHGVLSSSRGRVVQSRRDRSWRSEITGTGAPGRAPRGE
jgi:hypothetical protein